ncbi:MAG: ROK family protein [Anaerolineae bacterium]|nr:ROK family protein [Anaerolineae bacterium]MBL6965390.1 ROK family protein [Anaerolineales bacterium]
MTVFIAIDLGGTQMRVAAFGGKGFTPIHIERIPSQSPGASPQERLIQLITKVAPKGEQISAIGVAAPGPINPQKGIILTAPNIPGLVNFPLVADLQQKLNVPVFLDNDANLAALGEWQAGAGQGHNHLVYLTISTGIGGGIISAGHRLHGAQGFATEMGHITVLPDGPMCGCGHRGHLEAIASGTSIARWVKQEIAQGVPSALIGKSEISAKTVAEAARQGDPLSQAAYARAGYYLGQALADFLHIFNPSIVIFGGGVSRSGELLLNPVRKSLHQHILSEQYIKNLTITTAALGDDAGIIGALLLARQSTYV